MTHKTTYAISILLLILILTGAVFMYIRTDKHDGGQPNAHNTTVSEVTTQPKTTVGVQSVTASSPQTAAAILAGTSSRTITWTTTTYPANAGVNINLLKKTTASPATYTLVRRLATDTPNTGTFTWTPKAGEVSADLYIEVTCSTTYTFTQGCQISSQVIKAF